MSGVVTVTVEKDEAGVRLDRWFRRHYPALGHGRLEKLLRTGQIRVDGGRAKSATRLEAGQAVRVPPLGDATRRPTPSRTTVTDEDAALIRSLVIHRDDDVIALNKPPGLAVQGGSKVSRHIDGMLDAIRFDAEERPRLVHRLDRDTGGLLLLARSTSAAAKLAEAFRGREAQKTYWALVSGVPRADEGRIDAALVKAGPDGAERMKIAGEDGKRAITDYAVVETAAKRVSWLALRPLSGRTHQLRVHCAQMGTPILGDAKYGDEPSRVDGLPQPRLLNLHARAIVLPHPAGGMLRLTAPLHDAMAENWRFFGFDAERASDPPGFAGQVMKTRRRRV